MMRFWCGNQIFHARCIQSNANEILICIFFVLKFKCLNRAMFNHKVRKLFGFDMTNTEIRYWTWKVLNDQHFEPFWRTSWNIHWIDANCSFSFVLKFKLVQSKIQEVMTGDYFHIVWLVKSTLVNLSFCMNFLNRINWLLVWIIDWADLSDSDKMENCIYILRHQRNLAV